MSLGRLVTRKMEATAFECNEIEDKQMQKVRTIFLGIKRHQETDRINSTSDWPFTLKM